MIDPSLGILLGVGAGILFGLLVHWFWARQRDVAAYERGRSEGLPEQIALRERLATREQQVDELRSKLLAAEGETDRLVDQVFEERSARAAAEERALRIGPLTRDIELLREALQKAGHEYAELQSRLAVANTTLGEERDQTKEKVALLDEARVALSNQFRVLATEVLDQQSKKLGQQHTASLDALLKPLSERIKEFEKKVDDTYDKESKQRFALEKEVRGLQEQSLRLGQDAVSLANALRGQSVVRGAWGEVVLERVLEHAGLTKGREFDVQSSHEDEEGARQRPDVIIHLPEDRYLVIDSKVTLNAYERYARTEDEVERGQFLSEHLQAMRRHVTELSAKRYQNLPRVHGLDFVLMFVPLEPAYALAAQHSFQLFGEAMEKRVAIVSPNTLLPVMRTIASLWRQEYQNRNAQEIARESGRLYDKFVNFVTDLDELGRRLKGSQDSYDAARNKLVSGRGNLIGRAERLRLLGAATSKRLNTDSLMDDDVPPLEDEDSAEIPTPELPRQAPLL